MKLKKQIPKPNMIILGIIATITTITTLTLLVIQPKPTTLIAATALLVIINYIIYLYRDEIQIKIAQENEYKEWRTGKKLLNAQAIEKLKKQLPPQMQMRIGELQAQTFKQKQQIQELKKQLKTSTEVKTLDTAQKQHKNQAQQFKENAYIYTFPFTKDKEIKLIQQTPPGGYIGTLKQAYKKGNKILLEYIDDNGKLANTQPKEENELLPENHAELLKHSNALPVHLNKQGEFQPPAYILSE